MWCRCSRGIATLALLSVFAAHGFDIEEEILPRSDWPQYANGAGVSAIPAVRKALQLFEENGKMQIVIKYPGGDAGLQWGRELYRWMVAFGVPTQYLEMQPGSGGTTQLAIAIIDRS